MYIFFFLHIFFCVTKRCLPPQSPTCVTNSEGCVTDAELCTRDVADDCFCLCLKPDTSDAATLPLGHYLLYWRRWVVLH